MIKHDQQQMDGFLITPSEIQNEARSVDVDMQATNIAASTTDDSTGWSVFYAAWKTFFQPIDEASAYNPIGPLWWSGTMDSIRDWRARLITQQTALKQLGANVAVTAQQGSAGASADLTGALSIMDTVKWIAIGGAALFIGSKLLGKKKD
jgi:hypothetical protein